MKRNLSGIYFRVKDPFTEKYDSVCFEDLSYEQKLEVTKDKSPEFMFNLAVQLSETISKIGNQFDLINS